jgi:hypothetical protein
MKARLAGLAAAGLLLAAVATAQPDGPDANRPDADGLDADRLGAWLDGYGSAWMSRDAAAAAALFTPSARYFETPHADPFDGREGIAEYWANVTADQREIEFTSRVLAVDGNVGVAEWSATFVTASTGDTVGLDGVFILHFDDEGLCAELREWWFLRPPDAEPAVR